MRAEPAHGHLHARDRSRRQADPAGVALLSYKAVGGKEAIRSSDLAASFELIHSATLIHDDINDHGEIRRGKAAAYKKFGVQKALIAGDFLFVRSFRLGAQWNQQVVKIISEACTATAESEITPERLRVRSRKTP